MNHDIDHDRHRRIGFPEVVFGFSKRIEVLEQIIEEIYKQQGKVLVTKLQPDKAEILSKRFQTAFYDPQSSIFMLGGKTTSPPGDPEVAILAGGTSDEFIVNEIYFTLTFLDYSAECFIDIGVAGMHRLADRRQEIDRAKVLIVCAGFEGALPTVVGGLFKQPIIGVPVSVGYGVAEGGTVALNSMLSSCANGLTVTNIDNGYGAAIAAVRILNIMKKD